jgi:hypothetical protein
MAEESIEVAFVEDGCAAGSDSFGASDLLKFGLGSGIFFFLFDLFFRLRG